MLGNYKAEEAFLEIVHPPLINQSSCTPDPILGSPPTCKLDTTLAVNEDVGGLEVTVKDAIAVDVAETLEQLLHDALDLAGQGGAK